MDTELDEVYIAHIKSIFQEFDNEIIWTAIFEHGYDENGNYNTENTINYLLELSGDHSTPPKDNSISITSESSINHLDKNSNEEDDIPDDIEEDKEEEIEPSGISKIITSIPNLFQHGEVKYTKLFSKTV